MLPVAAGKSAVAAFVIMHTVTELQRLSDSHCNNFPLPLAVLFRLMMPSGLWIMSTVAALRRLIL